MMETISVIQKEPRLTLVGAGPGDPELITVKGVRAIQNADVVLYDALVSEDILKLIPSHVRNIADVSGAGDTVIAVAALVYAATQDVYLMATMANIAGGLVCEEVGTAAIDPNRLLEECELLIR